MLDRQEEHEFLRRFQSPGKKEVPVGYAMYCPYCKEGTAKTRRRVAYILTGNTVHNHNTFSCRRCGKSMSFKKFLKEQHPSLYDEYKERDRDLALKKLVEGRQKKQEEIKRSYPDLEFTELPESMIPAYQHSGAYKYCKRRRIPPKVIRDLKFAKKIIVESDGMEYEYDDMLVFPFYMGRRDATYGFQARSIKGKTFYTESQEGYKIYNFYNIDVNDTCYIFESIIDSLYIPNSIAMLGSDLPDHFLSKLKRPVFVFDNDVSEDTFKKMLKYKDHGVVIWPEFVNEKDVNEMICNDYSANDISDIIKENIHKGVAAEVRLGIAMNRKKRR